MALAGANDPRGDRAMTTIEWTDRVWNPVTGCTKVSQGCKHCYAEGIANRRLPHGGFKDREFTEVRCHPERLKLPLSWRKGQRVFVNSMSDLFHEEVPDEFIDKVFAVMALSRQHTFQVLTKRPERMRAYMQSRADISRDKFGPGSPCSFIVASELWRFDGAPTTNNAKHYQTWLEIGWSVWSEARPAGEAERMYVSWPLVNVWLGVSVEDQATADERIPPLLETPAALRFLSCEPLLELVTIFSLDGPVDVPGNGESPLHWVIVGGESGPGARPFDIGWARDIIEQCESVCVPVFVKQLGARPMRRCQCCRGYPSQCRMYGDDIRGEGHGDDGMLRRYLKDRKGGDIAEWPEDLRVREFPCA